LHIQLSKPGFREERQDRSYDNKEWNPVNPCFGLWSLDLGLQNQKPKTKDQRPKQGFTEF
jgi:hypothetical protein